MTIALGRQHFKVTATILRAFCGVGLFLRIADPEIIDVGQQGTPVESRLFLKLLVKRIDLCQFNGNFAAVVLLGFERR